MKKNFLMVASLLIAAMLLVVSCAQEVKAPLDNNLVEVTLNTSAARSALEYSGLDIANVTYRYRLTAQWKPDSVEGTDEIVGNTLGKSDADAYGYINFSEDPTSQNLGYVSQGLWLVEVIGKIGNNDVLIGSTQVYFNKNNNNSVTVYVSPINTSSNAGISLDINVNDHDATGTGYKLYYTIQDVGGAVAKGTVGEETNQDLTGIPLTRGNIVNDTDDKSTGYRNWTASATGMKPGYYRVTVTMKNGDDFVGGITKGVLLFAGDAANAKLTGSVNSMDFVEETLNVVYPNITLTLTSTLDSANKEGSVNTDVTYTATSEFTNSTSLPSEYTVADPSYAWYENGKKGEGTSALKTVDGKKASTYSVSYENPGYKTVTCVVTYTLQIPNGNNTVSTEKVSFAVQADKGMTVKINPANK